MTSFTIDTGDTLDDRLRYVPDWFRDQIDPITDPDAVLKAYGLHLVGTMQEPRTALACRRYPKKQETALKHLLAEWTVLRLIGEAHPQILTEILTAFAERQ